jgi:hypothetical protein
LDETLYSLSGTLGDRAGTAPEAIAPEYQNQHGAETSRKYLLSAGCEEFSVSDRFCTRKAGMFEFIATDLNCEVTKYKHFCI